jgi:hypothetical protein
MCDAQDALGKVQALFAVWLFFALNAAPVLVFLYCATSKATDIFHRSAPSPGVQGKAGMGSILLVR